MASVLDVCNLALQHLAISPIASLTEHSKEARVCNTLYPQVVDEVLRDFPWPMATTIQPLALVATDPNVEWAYSYRYPIDCVNFRRILSGITRVQTRTTRVKFRVIADSTGSLILTDQADAQAEYTLRQSDPTHYPADFVQATALLLAMYAAPSLLAGDPDKLGDRAVKLYDWRRGMAQANALDEEQQDDPAESDLITVRDGVLTQGLL